MARLGSALLVGVFAVVLVAPPSGAAAQETPVPAAGEAARFLANVASFGTGWTSGRTAGLEVDTDVFREGVVAVYAGPDGARVVAAALLVTQDRVAIRRSWEAANDLFDNYSGELEYLSGRDEELDPVPPPPGCMEAKRIDGTARQLGIDTGIPLGITLCAADPDLVVLVAASGRVLGLTGYEASDAIAALMVGGQPAGTPTGG